MFTTTLLASFLAISALASPVPIQKRDAPTDTDILQYALTLEHLENAFYSGALAQFADSDFANAGFAPFVRKRFVQIASHEQTHVEFLTSVLGSNATQACTYSFPYTDPKSFAALSMVLEGVGVTAYLGAAQFITSKLYLTAAGSILTTESRHAAWVASAVNKGTPWSGALDVPLDLDQVYSLASSFITSCPDSNPKLPVMAFPALSYSPASPAEGATISLTYNNAGSGQYLALFSGLSTIYLPINSNSVQLPSNLTGTVYGVVTSSNSAVSDDNTVAGPTILLFPDNS